jgi:hypothetical protein
VDKTERKIEQIQPLGIVFIHVEVALPAIHLGSALPACSPPPSGFLVTLDELHPHADQH